MWTRSPELYPAAEALLKESSQTFGLIRRRLLSIIQTFGVIGSWWAAFCTDIPSVQWCLGISGASLVYPAWYSLRSLLARSRLHRIVRESITKLRGNQENIPLLISLRQVIEGLDIPPHHILLRSFWSELGIKTGWIGLSYTRSGQRISNSSWSHDHLLAPHESLLSGPYREMIWEFFGGFLHVPSYLDAIEYIHQIPEPTEQEVLEMLFIFDPDLRIFGCQKYRMAVYNSSHEYVGFFENTGSGLFFTNREGLIYDFSKIFFQVQSSHPWCSYQEIIEHILRWEDYVSHKLRCVMQMFNIHMMPAGSVTRTEKGGLFFHTSLLSTPLPLKEKYDACRLYLCQNRWIFPEDPHHPQGWNEKRVVSHITLAHLYAAMFLEKNHLLTTAPNNIQEAWRDFCIQNARLVPQNRSKLPQVPDRQVQEYQ